MAQGVIYYLPHRSVFKLKGENVEADIAVDGSDIARGAFSAALEDANYKSPSAAPISADFILPHTMYGVDFITLPNIKRSQVDDAYKAELRSLYKNHKDLIFHKAEISSGKTVTFRVVFIRRSLIKELKDGFAKLGITLERFIPESMALYEGAAKADGSVRKSPCVILNIEQEKAYLAAYSNDTFLGGIPIPFGLKALSDSRLVYEKQLFLRDSAELLVINAKERAKSTKLTMAIDLEEEIDESIPSEDELIAENPELPDITTAGSINEDAAVEASDDEDEEAAIAVKTLRKSAVRVLPKFMRRDEPTTPQGYVLENFRMFEKRILMLLRDMSLNDYYPKIENIFIALPREYEFIIPEMKAQNPAYKWTAVSEYGDALISSGASRVGSSRSVVFLP